jgi:hypothetical protein
MSSSLSSTTPLNLRNSFELHGKDFHKLSQLENDFNRTFPIKLQEKIFKFTKEETYLLSPRCYSDILELSLPFIIPFPTYKKNNSINYESLIQIFEKLSLLFSTSTYITINQ